MTIEFTNQEAEELTRAMLAARLRCERSRKGQEWGRVMLTVASWYPEDRLAIMQAFGASPAPKPESGGAREVPSPYKNRKIEVPDNDCPGCPGNVTPKAPGKPLEAERAGGGSLSSVVDADFILTTYGSDTTKLAIHANRLGLKLGRLKNPRKIAERIADRMNEEE